MQRAKFFQFIEGIEKEYNKARYGTQPRDLEDEDLEGWESASEAGFHIKPRTREEVRAALRRRNPVRWAQCRSDLRWAERQMKKLGLNPEDARFML